MKWTLSISMGNGEIQIRVGFRCKWNWENILHSHMCLGTHVKYGQLENYFI